MLPSAESVIYHGLRLWHGPRRGGRGSRLMAVWPPSIFPRDQWRHSGRFRPIKAGLWVMSGWGCCREPGLHSEVQTSVQTDYKEDYRPPGQQIRCDTPTVMQCNVMILRKAPTQHETHLDTAITTCVQTGTEYFQAHFARPTCLYSSSSCFFLILYFNAFFLYLTLCYQRALNSDPCCVMSAAESPAWQEPDHGISMLAPTWD